MDVMNVRKTGAAWTPAIGMTSHDGSPIPADADFVVPPPAEIGEVLSAHSTFKPGKEPLSPLARLVVSLLGFVVPFVIVYAIVSSPAVGPRNRGERELCAWTFGGMAGLVVGLATLIRSVPVCSYVGKAGVARFTFKKGRGGTPRREVLEFARVTELITKLTDVYVNGSYTCTEYRFEWSHGGGNPLLVLKGKHHKQKKGPKQSSDPFRFAEAAELAWSRHLLASLDSQLERLGYLQFNLISGAWVRVGRGFMEFFMHGQTTRVSADEIKELSLAKGHFKIRHKDARFFGGKGKYDFNYATMANARLFLLALERLLYWDGKAPQEVVDAEEVG